MKYEFIPRRFIRSVSQLPEDLEDESIPLMFVNYKSGDDRDRDILLFSFIGGTIWYDASNDTYFELYSSLKGRWLKEVFKSNKISMAVKCKFVRRLLSKNRRKAFCQWIENYRTGKHIQ